MAGTSANSTFNITALTLEGVETKAIWGKNSVRGMNANIPQKQRESAIYMAWVVLGDWISMAWIFGRSVAPASSRHQLK